MIKAVPDILARIAGRKLQELALVLAQRSELERAAEASAGDRRQFRSALEQRRPAVIAEFKKASPSKGQMAAAADPAGVAQAYESGGAAAMSVLTDAEFFGGSFADLETARRACRLPVLRKDFTLDEVHVIEAAAHGADAVLLIAAILTADQMRQYRETAERYGMTALVEVHDEDELRAAIDSGAEIIGVNNRDLRTFQVSLETSLRLAEFIPKGVLKVAESGIHSRADRWLLEQAGFQAFLVGERLMTAPDPEAALRDLLS